MVTRSGPKWPRKPINTLLMIIIKVALNFICIIHSAFSKIKVFSKHKTKDLERDSSFFRNVVF